MVEDLIMISITVNYALFPILHVGYLTHYSWEMDLFRLLKVKHIFILCCNMCSVSLTHAKIDPHFFLGNDHQLPGIVATGYVKCSSDADRHPGKY